MKSIVAAVFIVGFANAFPNSYYHQMRMHAVPMVAMYPPPISAKLLTNPDCNPEEIPVASEGAMSFVYGAGDHIASGGFVAQTQQSGSVDTIQQHLFQQGVDKERVEKVTEIVPEVPAEPFDTGVVDQTQEETTLLNDSAGNKFETKIPESDLVIPVEIESRGTEHKVIESIATESSVHDFKVYETTGYKVLDSTLEASGSSISETDLSGSAEVKVYGSNTRNTDSGVEESIHKKVHGSIVRNKQDSDVKVSGSSFESEVNESSESKTTTVESMPIATTNVEDQTSGKVNKKTSTVDSADEHEEVYNRYDSRRGGTYFPIHFGSFPGARSDSGGSGGVVSIANSYSTGHGGVASSQATAYGSGPPASSS